MYTIASKAILRHEKRVQITGTNFSREINLAMKIDQEPFLGGKSADRYNPFQDFAKCAVNWRARVRLHAAKITASVEIVNS